MSDGKWDIPLFGAQVFVTRLAEQVTKDDLRTYFEQFGELTDLFVPLRNGGPGPDGKERHKGIAFLSFRDYEPFVEVLSREKYSALVFCGVVFLCESAMFRRKIVKRLFNGKSGLRFMVLF